jgi:Ferritin-like
MIFLQFRPLKTLDDALELLQIAVELEFSTLPPYLYALYSIKPGTNAEASSLIRSVAMEEMAHMCLACNILNALGKNPVLTAPNYPGPLPGSITGGGKQALTIHLYPFSKESMAQAMSIEEPEGGPIDFPHELAVAAAPTFITIGQFYRYLDDFLKKRPASDWKANRNQLDARQFLQGQILPVNNYADAHLAIQQIVSEGEGAKDTPLDFQGEVAHYYRFGELFYDQMLTKADNPKGYVWGSKLGVDWNAVYPAISDPGSHEFSKDSAEARAAQDRCDEAYTRLVQELQRAVAGEAGRLGNTVRAMFDLRMAARYALTVPLAVPTEVAGPSFRYRPGLKLENQQ